MELTYLQLDALKEISNIGSGHAATALSSLLQRKINMTVPEIWTMPLEQISQLIGNMEEPQAAVFLRVLGEAPGKAVFLFPLQSAQKLAQALFATERELDLFADEMVHSALKEVGNIMVNSFLIALTTLSGILLQPSVPAMAVDMAGAIIAAILLEDAVPGENVLFIDTQLSGMPQIEGQFIFVPHEGSLQKLLGAWGA